MRRLFNLVLNSLFFYKEEKICKKSFVVKIIVITLPPNLYFMLVTFQWI